MPKPVLRQPAPAAPAKPKRKARPLLSYRAQLRQRDTAGFGVILTRTREPARVLDVLKHYSFTRKNRDTGEFDTKYRQWDCVRGWVEYGAKVEHDDGKVHIKELAPTALDKEPETDVNGALCAIQDVKGLGAAPWPACIAVFNYPHFAIKDNAEFITTLKGYCHSLPTGRTRVVLVVPEGFTMPSELEDDITILDFAVPTQDELTARFHALMRELGMDKKHPYTERDVAALTSAGLGMTELDFDQAITLAITELAPEGDIEADITAPVEDFLSVISICKREAVKRTNILELIEPLAGG